MDQINLAKFFFVIQAIAVSLCLVLVFLSKFTPLLDSGPRGNVAFWAVMSLITLSVSFILVLYVAYGNVVDMGERGLTRLFFITLMGPAVIVIGWFFARMQIQQVDVSHQDPHIQIFTIAFGAFIFFSSVIIGLFFTLIGSFFFEWGLSKALKEKM